VTPPPDEPAQPFDAAVCAELQTAIQGVLLRHPEVAAVAASICWKGNLNDARIRYGVWVGEQGPVTELPVMFGSAYQGLKVLEDQCGQIMQWLVNSRKAVFDLAEIHRANEAARAPDVVASTAADAGGPAG